MNPYSVGSPFPNLSPTINSFVDNLVKLKTHQDDIDLRGRTLQQGQDQFNTQQYGTPTPQPGQQTLPAQQLDLQRQEAAKKPPLPAHQQVINPAEVRSQMVMLKTAYGEGALKVLAPALGTIDEIAAANPNTTKWDAYVGAKGAWAGQRDEIIDNADKYIMSPEFEKLKPAQKEAFSDLYNKIKYDKTGDIIHDGLLFKNTVASKKQEDENAKAAVEAAKIQARIENSKPDRQYVMAKKTQYEAAGMDENTATIKAVEDLYKEDAKKLREGRTVIGGIGNIPPGVGGAPAGKPGERNEGALQGLNSTQQATVKAIVDYKFPVTNLRNKEVMALVQRAYQYDPTFDAKEYQVRQGVRKDFTSGNASKSILSLNTAVGHLESMAKAGEELKNSNIQLWNRIANFGLTATGDPRVTKFNTTATAVSGELATVFKSTSGTDQEIKAWRDNISAIQSPEQIKAGGVDQAVELIGSRLVALANKYEQGMGRPMDFQILSDKSRAILKRLGVDISKYEGATGVNAPAAPAAQTTGGRKPLSAY